MLVGSDLSVGPRLSVSSGARSGVDRFVVLHLGEDGIEALEALLGLSAVALDPLGHQVEHLCFQVHRAALGLPAAAHQAEVFDLMTKWIERYRRQAEERYRRLDDVLAEMDTDQTRPDTERGAS